MGNEEKSPSFGETDADRPILAVQSQRSYCKAVLAMNATPRCHARAKRTGERCKKAACVGWEVCDVHGAGSGAPDENQNAFKHGLHSQKHKTRRERDYQRRLKLISKAMNAQQPARADLSGNQQTTSVTAPSSAAK
jgi:hypothetical protein